MMSLRVIAGSLKGRRLETPTWEALRPTSDKLRETLFNILASRTAGARVLDLYAGTGALGIEAISRGAAHVTFVERDRRAQALIAANLARCGIVNGYAIIRGTVARALETLGGAPPFDIVLLDPPYDQPVDAVLATLGRPVLVVARGGVAVARDGVVVVEHARRRPVPDMAGRLVRIRDVTSGDSALAMYACPP